MEIINNIFSKTWWEEFLQTTDNLSRTSVFKDCLDRETTSLFRRYVLEILKTLSELRTTEYGYRIYKDGILLNSEKMQKIFDVPFNTDDTIESWSERVFGSSKFGMILNLGEKFNTSLSRDIALIVEPYLELIGYPRDGINFSIFIGNYDKTPLGIHQDPPGQDVMHFHLGKGKKTMYTWGRDQYEQLTSQDGIGKQDLEQLLPLSNEFTFEEGDIYFMPEGEYHIGKQENLSIAITFWRYNHNEHLLLKKLQQIIDNQYLVKNTKLLSADRTDVRNSTGINQVLENINLPENMESLTYKELLKEAYSDLRFSIHSNAGYRSNPFPKEYDIEFKLKDNIELEKPFKILYKDSYNGDKLHIYVRGTKIELQNFECIKTLVDEINKGQKIETSHLLGLLNPEWGEEIGLYILNLLHKNHGIVLSN